MPQCCIDTMDIRPSNERRGHLNRPRDNDLRRNRNREAAVAMMIPDGTLSRNVYVSCGVGIGHRNDHSCRGIGRHVAVAKDMQATHEHVDDRQQNCRKVPHIVRATSR